jgi:hypothetical protein
MSERALRGTRLGATSYETDSGIDLAPRQEVEYSCPSGHRFSVPFSVEAEVPVAWECRVCGAQALRVGGTFEENKPVKPVRTHWDMLLERRSIPELEEVLAERLEVLRGGGIGSGIGARARRSAPMNMSTGAPAAARQAGTATATAPTGGGADEAGPSAAGAKPAGSTRTVPAKKPAAKKTTAGTAPAKKTAASKGSPATKAADKPVKKPTTKKPSSK